MTAEDVLKISKAIDAAKVHGMQLGRQAAEARSKEQLDAVKREMDEELEDREATIQSQAEAFESAEAMNKRLWEEIETLKTQNTRLLVNLSSKVAHTPHLVQTPDMATLCQKLTNENTALRGKIGMMAKELEQYQAAPYSGVVKERDQWHQICIQQAAKIEERDRLLFQQNCKIIEFEDLTQRQAFDIEALKAELNQYRTKKYVLATCTLCGWDAGAFHTLEAADEAMKGHSCTGILAMRSKVTEQSKVCQSCLKYHQDCQCPKKSYLDGINITGYPEATVKGRRPAGVKPARCSVCENETCNCANG